MSQLGRSHEQISIIFYFSKLGFVGPKSGAKRQYMIKGVIKVPPN